jgi:hypothetical protein
MAKLTLDGVTVTKVTLDGVEITSLKLDGGEIFTLGTQYTDLHTNPNLIGGGNGVAPDDMINVYSGDTTMVNLGGGNYSFEFNPDGASDQRMWEYRVENSGANGVALVNGNTYRYEVDCILTIATDGEVGLDATRGGLSNITIDETLGTLVLDETVKQSVEFTVNSATHLIRFRHGVGHGGAATGAVIMKNPRLLDLGAPLVTTYTHSMLVWHGVNSAGMDASVPGGSITPLPIDSGEADVTRITSIASGAPQLHVLGTQDVGATVTVTFQGGISFTGTGVDYQGTHTRFIGDNDGDALYNYLAAEEGNNIDFDISFTPFVASFSMTHQITPYDGTTIAGYDLTNGGSFTPLPVAAGKDDVIHLTSTSGGAPVLMTAGINGSVGDTVLVKLDSGNLEFFATGVSDGTNTVYTGPTDLNDAIFDYLLANATVQVDIEIQHTVLAVPSPNIHDMPVVDYSTGQATFLEHIDHTSDSDDANYTSTEYEARYDMQWSTLTNVSIEDGRLKCIVDAGEYKKGIQSGGNLDDDYDELYMTYEFEFANGFDFVLGGKLPGLSGRPGSTGAHADGCNPQGQDGGFSARMMFRPDGKIEGYFYHEDQPGSCGHSVAFTDGGEIFKVRNGTTYLMEIRVIMNTPGNRDGIVECKINGVQVLRKANFRFSNNGNHGINHKFIQMWHGGSSSSWAPSQDSTFYMNHMTISTSPLVY